MRSSRLCPALHQHMVHGGLLYHAYQSKETLFLRVYEMYRARYLQQVQAVLDQPGLRAALDGYLEYVVGSLTVGVPTRGCLTISTALGRDSLDAPIRAVSQGMMDQLEALLAQRMGRSDATGLLRSTPHDAARLPLAFTHGLVVLERIYPNPARLREDARLILDLLIQA